MSKIAEWVRENKLKAAIYGVVGLVVFGFLNLELLHFSSSPPFCREACHSMILEVDNWRASRHGRLWEETHGKQGADCVHCHYREGALWYMFAKMMAMNDLKNTILGIGGRPMSAEDHFGHADHMPFFEDYSEEVLEQDRLMDDIILPQYVHNPTVDQGGRTSTHMDEHGNYRIQIHRYGFLFRVLNENCKKCHSSRGNRGQHSPINVGDFVVRNALLSFKGKVEKRRKGVKVPHAFHLDRGVNCTDCHAEVVHGPQELMDSEGSIYPRMKVCFRCHNDKRAPRECTLCHTVQLNMNLGTGGIDIEDTPNYMYPDEATCTDCHLEENDYKMKPAVCIDCHGDDSYGEIMTDWQNDTGAQMAEVGPRIKEVEAKIAEARRHGMNVEKAEKLFSEADFNYSMVVNDGTKGAHNPEYAPALLNMAKEKLSLVEDVLAE